MIKKFKFEDGADVARQMVPMIADELGDVITNAYDTSEDRGLNLYEVASAVTTALTGVMVSQIMTVAVNSDGDPVELAEILHRHITHSIKRATSSPSHRAIVDARRELLAEAKKGKKITREEMQRAMAAAAAQAHGGVVQLDETGDGEVTQEELDRALKELIGSVSTPAPDQKPKRVRRKKKEAVA